MPFYIRTRPRRPLWIPALWGAAAMLVWASTQAFLLGRGGAPTQLGGLGRGLYVIGLSAVAAGTTCALSWALGSTHLRERASLRLVSAATGVAICLVSLTLAAGLAKPEGPWFRLARVNFWLSTGLVSLILGWFVANDPFDVAKHRERVYLTPAAFAKLSPSEQALLRLDSTAPETSDTTSAG